MRKLVLVGLVLAFGCASNTKMNTGTDKTEPVQTLFTVDNIPVGTEEFVYVYKKNNINNDSAYTKADVDDYLDLYVKFKLKIKEAQKRGMDTTQAFYDEFNTYKDQLKKPYLTQTKITDSLIQEAYDRMQYEINASHILVKVDANAPAKDTLEAYQKIIDIRENAMTATDFGQLAKEFSDDPSAKTNSGNLGYFTAFQMVYPFETAAYATKAGEVSEPVRTRFGYHILKVLDKRSAQGSVEVSHIMVRVQPTNEDSLNARNKIFEIHEQALAGVPWQELASQFSDDINTKEKGGRLRPFSVGQMPFSFQEASFALNETGQISDPFMTPYGWHIVRLEKRDPPKSFYEVEASLKSRINRDTRAVVNKKALINRLKKENDYVSKADVSTIYTQYFDSSLVQGKWKKPALQPEKNIDLFIIGNEAVQLGEFLDYVDEEQKNNSYELKEYLNILYRGFEQEKIINYEETHLEDKYIDYRMLVKEYREGILLFQLMEEEVWSKAVKDSVGLHAFFEQNRSRYKWEKRVKAVVYNAADANVMAEIKDRLKNTPDLSNDELDSTYNKDSSLALKITDGVFESGDNPTVDQVTWEPGQYELSKDGRSLLVVIREVLDPAPKELKETRGMVISDYQNALEKQWIKQLREKYSVDIKGAGLKQVYESLL